MPQVLRQTYYAVVKYPSATCGNRGDYQSTFFHETLPNAKKGKDIPCKTMKEQSGAISKDPINYGGTLQQPSLHVGVLPVNAYPGHAIYSKVQELWRYL